jgi:arsenate reductase (thioredoxin)
VKPETRKGLEQVLEALHEEFAGIFGPETIDRFVDETCEFYAEAPIQTYVHIFVHRFARERLQALARVEGRVVSDTPEVLFVCVHNAGRSQMAAALLDHHADGRVIVRSAGSAPADEVNPAVIAAMDEINIDISKEFPKPLTDEVVRAADVVITMGCGDACPVYPGKRYLDWELEDPAGKGVEAVRPIRDEIDRRIRSLVDELVPAGG